MRHRARRHPGRREAFLIGNEGVEVTLADKSGVTQETNETDDELDVPT